MTGVNQESRAHAFFESAGFEVSHLFAQFGEIKSNLNVQATFMCNDLRFFIPRRIREFDGDKALPGRVFEVLENALVARVIRNAQKKIRMRFEDLAFFVNW